MSHQQRRRLFERERMTRKLTQTDRDQQNVRRRRAWAKQAPKYDKQIGWFERRVFGGNNREWACGRAQGDVLEVAVGTGLNLPFYSADVRLTALDLSPAMLEIARLRSADLGRAVDLREGDAHHLPFLDASFDSVVCTLSLCNIPDVDLAVTEMKRVLRPGGRLVLVDHIRSGSKPVFLIQKLIEFFSVRIDGDRMTRRPSDQVKAHGFEIKEQERFRFGGIIERLVAVKPA
jgi:ubiquinone/menaquinone biosynthesis C-methylase UbiE